MAQKRLMVKNNTHHIFFLLQETGFEKKGKNKSYMYSLKNDMFFILTRIFICSSHYITHTKLSNLPQASSLKIENKYLRF